MAKKKRGSRGHKRQRPASPPPPKLPDRRAMESVMQQLVSPLHGPEAVDSPLHKAQQVAYRAFGEADETLRVHLAREALDLSPDCADAYVLLAEHAGSRREARHLYEQGVAAGERAIGPEIFQHQVGRFWGLLGTRPYLRARLGLAQSLWTCGQREDAVRHLQDILRLNRHDNQGVRYTLAGYLLYLDRDEELDQLLRQFPEEASATWAYTKALLTFRKHGDTPEARQLLREAIQANPHVPIYLAGEKVPPVDMPDHYSPGQESEALIYLGNFLAGWKFTPGAVAWLRDQAQPKEPTSGPSPRGPLTFIKKWLNKNLPQSSDEWQADVRLLPSWIGVAGRPMRPWVVLVTSVSNGLVLSHEILEAAPSAEVLWDLLLKAMQHPVAGEPHRPTQLQVRPDDRWTALRPHLHEIGIRLDVAEELGEVEEAFTSLCAYVCGETKPGLLDVPGMTRERVGSFYQAAADFFREAPWKKVGYEAAIKVESDKWRTPWYAGLMGQSGLTLGLALYEDVKVLQKMWAGVTADEDFARETVATSVTFGEEWHIPVNDLEAARKHGWPVARPDAYPAVLHKDRGPGAQLPMVWQLELMEACLRAVPPFVSRHRQDDPAVEEMTVHVASGPLTVRLSWVVGEGA